MIMGAFLTYSIEVAVIMSVLYLGFKWLLASATFHRFNRVVLLLIIAVSFMMPLSLSLFRMSTQVSAVELGMPVAVAVGDVAVSDSPAGDAAPVDWVSVFSLIYAAGFCVALAFTVAGAVRMARIFRNARKLDGYANVAVSTLASSPFSWGGRIIVTEGDLDADLPKVVTHESAHLRLLHWTDLILAQIVILLQWFSPAAYLMMREIKAVHEFEVDGEVSASDPYNYQMMLIKKTAGASFPTFADSLNSQLKLRITMMLSKRSNESRRFAALALVPMAAIAALGLSQPVVADALSILSPRISSDEVSVFSPDSQTFDNESAPLLAQASVNDSPQDGKEELKVIGVGTIKKEEAEKKVEPVTINGDGSVQGSDKKPHYILDGKPFNGDMSKIKPENIQSITVRKDSPEYPEGCIEIYTKEYAKTHLVAVVDPVKKDLKSKDGSPVPKAVEKLAEYPGGQSAMIAYFVENMKYPEGPEENAFSVVQFVVEKDGSISDARIIKSGGERFDNEALRLVKGMPTWIPAENDGKPVASMFSVPIRFKKAPAKTAK